MTLLVSATTSCRDVGDTCLVSALMPHSWHAVPQTQSLCPFSEAQIISFIS